MCFAHIGCRSMHASTARVCAARRHTLMWSHRARACARAQVRVSWGRAAAVVIAWAVSLPSASALAVRRTAGHHAQCCRAEAAGVGRRAGTLASQSAVRRGGRACDFCGRHGRCGGVCLGCGRGGRVTPGVVCGCRGAIAYWRTQVCACGDPWHQHHQEPTHRRALLCAHTLGVPCRYHRIAARE